MAKRIAHKASRAPQLNQALFAIAVLAFVFMAALYFGNGLLNLKRNDLAGTVRPETSTGSILFERPNGNDCQQFLLDNNTGLIREGGIVDCDSAKAAAAKGIGAYIGDRKMNTIRKAFRGE